MSISVMTIINNTSPTYFMNVCATPSVLYSTTLLNVHASPSMLPYLCTNSLYSWVPGSPSSMLCSHLEPHHPTAFPWTPRCLPELLPPALSSAHLPSPSSEFLTPHELRGRGGPAAARESFSTLFLITQHSRDHMPSVCGQSCKADPEDSQIDTLFPLLSPLVE